MPKHLHFTLEFIIDLERNAGDMGREPA